MLRRPVEITTQSGRRFVLMLSLLAALCAAAPAFAQSDALKQAWQQTNTLIDADKYTEAETWAKKAVDLAQTESGTDSVNYAISLNNLAELYRAQGRYAEAEPLYKRALAIYEKALGPDHPAVATGLNNLALLYYEQGRYAEAEPLYKRALAIREKALAHGPAQAQRMVGDVYPRLAVQCLADFIENLLGVFPIAPPC